MLGGTLPIICYMLFYIYTLYCLQVYDFFNKTCWHSVLLATFIIYDNDVMHSNDFLFYNVLYKCYIVRSNSYTH